VSGGIASAMSLRQLSGLVCRADFGRGMRFIADGTPPPVRYSVGRAGPQQGHENSGTGGPKTSASANPLRRSPLTLRPIPLGWTCPGHFWTVPSVPVAFPLYANKSAGAIEDLSPSICPLCRLPQQGLASPDLGVLPALGCAPRMPCSIWAADMESSSNNIPAARKLAMDLNPEASRHLAPGIEFLQQDCSAPWPLVRLVSRCRIHEQLF